MPGGISVRQTIDINGNNLLADSYDSSDPSKSSFAPFNHFGDYDPIKYVGDKGNVVCGSVTNTLSIAGGHMNIYGQLATALGQSAFVGSQGGIGSHAWQAITSGIEPNGTEGKLWYTHDADYIFARQILPYANGLAPSGPAMVIFPPSGFLTNVAISDQYPTNGSPDIQDLTTNYTWFTNSTLQPPPTCCVITNPICGTCYTNQTTPPVSGTYCRGTAITNNNNGKKYYTYCVPSGTNYTYAVATSYTYKFVTRFPLQGTNYFDHVLSSTGDYYSTESFSGNTLVMAEADLVLPNGLNMGGADSVTLERGARLAVYCGGTNCAINLDAFNNPLNPPRSLVIACAPTVAYLTLNGGAGFQGIILAPNSDVTLNGGGNSTTDFSGLLVANSLRLNGNLRFHYDESLASWPRAILYATASATLAPPYIYGGQTYVHVSGVLGFDYVLQASLDGRDWIPLCTNTAPFWFPDLDAPNHNQRLYRAVTAP